MRLALEDGYLDPEFFIAPTDVRRSVCARLQSLTAPLCGGALPVAVSTDLPKRADFRDYLLGRFLSGKRSVP
eukprot:6353265-Lingulodinium_polyedra.AAC.1